MRRKSLDFMIGIGSLLFKWIVLPLLVIGVIYSFFIAGNKIGWLQFLGVIAFVVGVILTIFGLIWVVDTYGHKFMSPIGKVLRKVNPTKWSIIQIIGGMIYATYVKACPVIQWEGKEVKKGEYGIN